MKKKKKTNNEIKIQLIIIFILIGIFFGLMYIYFNRMNFRPREENVIKETSAKDVDEGVVVNDKEINLLNYNSNITIKEGGEYNIFGRFSYSILVNSTEKVILNLKNVYIQSSITSAIANINTGDLVINVVDGTENTLKDNGSSEFDGCIYSKGKLYFEGNGKLYVYGNQEEGEGIATTDNDITINSGDIYIESKDDGINCGGDNGGIITINDGTIFVKASGDGIDSNNSLIINGGNIYTMGSSLGGDAGIDTDKGFEINGGQVVALGSDMLQNPDLSSKQKYISFNLKSKINKNSKVSLRNSSGNEIISFEAYEDFKTLIISNSSIVNDTYYLYVNGEKTNNSKKIS